MAQRQCRQHCWGQLQRLLPNPNTLVVVSKGMQAVKLCINKIPQFLTGGASQLTQVDTYHGRKTVLVVAH